MRFWTLFLILCCLCANTAFARSLTFTAGETAVAKGVGIEYAQRSGQVEWAAFAYLNGNVNEGKALLSADPTSWCRVMAGPIVGLQYQDTLGARLYGGAEAKVLPHFGKEHLTIKAATRHRGSTRFHHLVVVNWMHDWSPSISAGPVYQPILRSDHSLPWDHRFGVQVNYSQNSHFTLMSEVRMSTGSADASYGVYHRVSGHIELAFKF